jgi:hypothetical protein
VKRVIRDDIINLNSYVEAEFKYREELEVIKGVGGYFFLEQVKLYWQHKGGDYFITKMEDANLLIKETFGKYVYYRLSSTALKYLKYRDSHEDYSDKSKCKLPGSSLSAHPSEKVLFTSSMLFAISALLTHAATKPKHIETLENFLFVDRRKEKVEIQRLLNLLETEIEDANLVNQSTTMALNRLSEEIRSTRKHVNKLYEDVKTKEDQSTLLKSNKHEIEKISLEIDLKNTSLSVLLNIKEALPYLDLLKLERKKEILLLDLDNFKKEEAHSRIEGQKIIDRFLKYRDSGKVILTLSETQEALEDEFQDYRNTPKSHLILNVRVLSVRHPHSYLGIVRNALDLVNKSYLNKYVDHISISFISVFEGNIYALEKELNELQKESNYRFKYSTSYTLLKSMQSYLQLPNSDISYIKRKDVDVFEALRNKFD